MSDLIAGYVRHMKAGGLSRVTIEDREALLRRVDRELPMGIERCTVDELADWLARDGWSAKTRVTYYEHIHGLFRWATDPRHPILDYDPSACLARPRVRRKAPNPITEHELAVILTGARGYWRIAALLAAYEGARCGDVAALRREDVTEESCTFHGKGGLVAVVPTHPSVWAAVRDFPPGSLARTSLGREATADYVSVMFRKLTRRLGLPGVSLHRLRHRFGTMLLMSQDLGGAGADLRTVQELMRHSSPSITAIYTQITDRQRRIAVAALPIVAPSPC